MKRPNEVKVFGEKAMQGEYLPVAFGTDVVVGKDLDKIANANFEYGLESLEKDLQLKDLNSVLFYHSALLKYLFENGIPEFSGYESYKTGSVVKHKNALWIATQDVEPSLRKPEANPCVPCSTSMVCGEVKEPSKENNWCKVITSCEYDSDKESLETSIQAVNEAVKNLKGVKGFAISNNTISGKPELTLTLSDDSTIVIPMDKFGSVKQNQDKTITITNADGSIVNLPRYVAAEELDQSRGFLWNNGTNKWEVDLSDLIRAGSGLSVDRGGNLGIADSYTKAIDDKIKDASDLASRNAEKAKADAIREVKESIASSGATVKTNPETSGLIGDGTANNPLRINHSDEFQIINGKLFLKAVEPKKVDDLNNLSQPIRRYGFTPFYGIVNNTTGSDYVIGMVPDFNAEVQQIGTTSIGGLASNQNYDFNGWQLASKYEVQQFISNNGITWERSNDFGMKPDGTLNNPSGWSAWRRSTNANITSDTVNNLVDQLRGLTERLTTAEQANQAQNQNIEALKRRVQALELPCEVTIKNVSNHTVTNEDNVIVSNGGVVTFPNNLKVGRSFTVIRNGNSNVTLEGITTQNGKVLTTDKTAATVVVTAQGINMAFGSLK